MTGRYSLNEQVDTAAPLWERSFKCRVPQLQTTSIAYLQRVGTISSGDANVDRQLADQLLTTYKPIHEMAELHRDGIPVYLCDRGDAKTIYDLVDQHLNAWKMNMGVGLHRMDAPVEDLVALDSFANSVFGITRFDMVKGEENSPFMRFLNGLSENGPLKSVDVKIVTNEEPEEDLPQRESYADAFKKSVTPGQIARWDWQSND